MRLSDLLGARVTDVDGRSLGAVRDVRLVQDGPMQGTFGAGLCIQGLIVGNLAIASRLGYDRLGTQGPWLVAQIAARLQRGARWVPWDEVRSVETSGIELRCAGDALRPPVPLQGLGGRS